MRFFPEICTLKLPSLCYISFFYESCGDVAHGVALENIFSTSEIILFFENIGFLDHEFVKHLVYIANMELNNSNTNTDIGIRLRVLAQRWSAFLKLGFIGLVWQCSGDPNVFNLFWD